MIYVPRGLIQYTGITPSAHPNNLISFLLTVIRVKEVVENLFRTRAARVLIDRAIEERGIHRVEWRVSAANEAGIAVARRRCRDDERGRAAGELPVPGEAARHRDLVGARSGVARGQGAVLAILPALLPYVGSRYVGTG